MQDGITFRRAATDVKPGEDLAGVRREMRLEVFRGNLLLLIMP